MGMDMDEQAIRLGIHELIGEYAETIARGIEQALRYEDPDLVCQHHPAEISSPALTR